LSNLLFLDINGAAPVQLVNIRFLHKRTLGSRLFMILWPPKIYRIGDVG